MKKIEYWLPTAEKVIMFVGSIYFILEGFTRLGNADVQGTHVPEEAQQDIFVAGVIIGVGISVFTYAVIITALGLRKEKPNAQANGA